jgi:hypothetical protein
VPDGTSDQLLQDRIDIINRTPFVDSLAEKVEQIDQLLVIVIDFFDIDIQGIIPAYMFHANHPLYY